MKYINLILSLAVIFSNWNLCDASFFNNLIPSTCKLKNVATSLDPLDLEDIFSYLKSQEGAFEDLRKSLSTFDKTFEKSFFEASENDEDQYLNITELIKKYGYNPEVHEVTTDDGYVLTMHRIPGDGPVVFLMHGLLGSADNYITPGENSLAFLLATKGYDVWLGNGRGCKHSRKHVSLSPECEEFWEFSFDETGRHDLPAMIDYALDTSGNTNLTYVGFSQGTSNLLVLCSELPEYNNKISLAVLLAPICFMSDTKSPLVRIAALGTNYIVKIVNLLGLNELIPDKGLIHTFIKFFCGDNPLSKFVCGSVVPLMSGFDTGLLNVKRVPAFLAHFPAGCSARQLAHYGQNILSEKFRKYNFEKSKNEEVYGSEEPPEYPLDEITTPVAMFYGDSDWLANVSNVHQLRYRLPNVVYTKMMPNYGHEDILLAENVHEELHVPLLDVIKKYQ